MKHSTLTKLAIAGVFILPIIASAQDTTPISTAQNTAVPTAESSLSCIDKNLQGNWFLAASQGIETRPVHLQITGESLYLNAGCNSISGIVGALENSKVNLYSTRMTAMGCPGNYEAEFSEIFFESDSYQRHNDRLTFINADNRLIFDLVNNASHILGKWKVSGLNINGGISRSADQPNQSINFEAGGVVTGSDGCNSFSGLYEVSGETIKISEMSGTLMLCMDETQKWANAFGEALRKADQMQAAPKSIRLGSASDGTLVTLYRE